MKSFLLIGVLTGLQVVFANPLFVRQEKSKNFVDKKSNRQSGNQQPGPAPNAAPLDQPSLPSVAQQPVPVTLGRIQVDRLAPVQQVPAFSAINQQTTFGVTANAIEDNPEILKSTTNNNNKADTDTALKLEAAQQLAAAPQEAPVAQPLEAAQQLAAAPPAAPVRQRRKAAQKLEGPKIRIQGTPNNNPYGSDKDKDESGNSNTGNSNTGMIVGVVIGVFGLVMAIVGSVLWIRSKTKEDPVLITSPIISSPVPLPKSAVNNSIILQSLDNFNNLDVSVDFDDIDLHRDSYSGSPFSSNLSV